MRKRAIDRRFRRILKSPPVFLAHCGMKRGLRDETPRDWKPGEDGFVIFVTPSGYRIEDYRAAASHLFARDPEAWTDDPRKVRVASSRREKRKSDDSLTVFDLDGLAVILTARLDDVPQDVRFAASYVISIDPPSARQIQAARRLAGHAPISDEMAASLSIVRQNVMIAAIARPTLDPKEIAAFGKTVAQPVADGPTLFELPGYDQIEPWAKGICSDVGRWRAGNLSWSDVCKGALIVGPPGTGKTLFATAFANAAGLRLISATIGLWQSAGPLDDTLRAMRASFDDANDGRGAVLFIDEIDSIGTRPHAPTGHHGDHYWQIVLNEFLSLLSRIGEGVIVIGGTNLPDWIDAAVLRAGRLERRFTFSLPDHETRAEILDYHLEGILDFKSLLDIAEDLEGASGSKLEQIVRDARKQARDNDRELTLQDLRDQVPERVLYTTEQLFRLAAHEAGHALVSLATGYASSASISIKQGFVPSECSVPSGITQFEVVEDHLPTETTLLNRIAVALAGMAAESVVCGDRSIGAGGVVGSDLERATALARRMVASYGFGTTPVFVDTIDHVNEVYLPDTLRQDVLNILHTQYERVVTMLGSEHDRVIALAHDVVHHRTVKIDRSTRDEAA